MIHFIFAASVLVVLLLICGFLLKAYPLVSISAMGMIVIGVYILINGMEDLSNLLTISLGVIFVAVGLYIMVKGSMDLIEASGI